MEFALAFPVVFVVLLAILEMGFAFSAYATVVWAAREGARVGALYVYNTSCTKAENDSNRESGAGCSLSYDGNIRTTVERSLGWLNKGSPHFLRDQEALPTGPGVTVQYIPQSYPPGAVAPDSRKGDTVKVTVTYRYHWLTPVLSESYVRLAGSGTARIE